MPPPPDASSSPPRHLDFWYAVRNTTILLPPRNPLETFGNTLIHYHLLTEPMDQVGAVRHREGRIQAYRPEILTPDAFAASPLAEGFRDGPSDDFIRWLRRHADDIAILKYGFRIRQETTSETLLHTPLPDLAATIRADLLAAADPFSALVLGVDEPWEVCLLKLLFDTAGRSAPANARELRADPDGSRHRAEAAFRDAARDRSRIPALAALLQELHLFDEYEDRFYALVRNPS
ncbi:MAG: hypothetical protein IJT88_06345 [Kiritimatiellae bacterium]|nr:hypothetical protein [Kiritimatiellia bacterium]